MFPTEFFDPDMAMAQAIEQSLREHAASHAPPQRPQNFQFRYQPRAESPPFDMSGFVRADQDAEYLETVREVQRRQQADRDRRAQEEANRKREIDAKVIERETILALVETLDPEPEDGCEVRVVLPRGRIVARRFAPEVNGNDVYLWISSQDEMFDRDKFPIAFRLVFGVQTVLERMETLEVQNIARRVQFRVLLR
jgi:hypothetical protein